MSESKLKNPTTSNDTIDGLVLDIVRRDIPLNEKQNFVSRKLITDALAWNDNLFDASNDGPTNFESPMQCCTSFIGTNSSELFGGLPAVIL